MVWQAGSGLESSVGGGGLHYFHAIDERTTINDGTTTDGMKEVVVWPRFRFHWAERAQETGYTIPLVGLSRALAYITTITLDIVCARMLDGRK